MIGLPSVIREADAFDIIDQASVTIGEVETLLSLLDDLQVSFPVPDELRRVHEQKTVLIDTITRTVESVHEDLRAALNALTTANISAKMRSGAEA